jgi:NADH:ubiquinone oxidoreductase subunit D
MNIGRNEPCPCGSKLKFKKCCLIKDELNRQEILQKSRKLTGDNLAEYLLSLGVIKEDNDPEWQEWFRNDLAEGQRNLQEAKETQEKNRA